MSTYWTAKKVHMWATPKKEGELNTACKVHNKSLAIKVTASKEDVTCKRCLLYIAAEERRSGKYSV